MKTRNLNQKFILIPMSIMMALIFAGIISCIGQKNEDKVFEAYELRMNGHSDSAKVILKQLLSTDSTNALAWFELCRTIEHVGMANPRAIKEMLDETLYAIDRAVEYAPSNAYYLSYKGNIKALQFYFALQTGNEKARDYLFELENTYKSVFKLDPTYYEDKITLVEFFGGLPAEFGGDSVKAERYARELEEADLVAGAKARGILMPEDADYEIFWREIVENDPNNADPHQALGRIYLFQGSFDEASDCYQKAIGLDKSKSDLYLDLGRYHLMTAMQNPALIDSVAPFIKEQFNKFLEFTPEPNKPMKAWVYFQLAMIDRHSGNIKNSEKLLEIVEDLDPFYSKASGKPGKALYSPPDEIVHEQRYFLSPF